jgi:conjugative transfer signal peptidase TraF
MKIPGPLIGMLLGLVAIFASAYATLALRLVYNTSDSAPRGWYAVHPMDQVRRGDDVVARLPQDVAMLAATRGYVPTSIPVLKRVAAVGGQHVCVRDGLVHVDGERIGSALDSDGVGRPLTAWRHCRRLLAGELFLMNSAVQASFDSRYFGPIDVSFVRGRAIRLAMFE